MQHRAIAATPLYLVISLIAGLVLGIGSFAFATSTTISACAKRDGSVYLIGTGFRYASCLRGDTPLSWNTQGLKGDTGAQGPVGAASTVPGPKGDKGDPGTNGTSLHLFDANGQDLGLVVGRTPWSTTYLSDASGFISFTGATAHRGYITFFSTDCSGQAYAVFSSGSIQDALVVPGVNRFFKVTETGDPGGTMQSELTPAGCQATSTSATTATAEEFASPFTLPLAAPLQAHFK